MRGLVTAGRCFRAIVDELVRRLGVDEKCRQLAAASIEELYRLPDPDAAV